MSMKRKRVLVITDSSYPNLTMNGVVIKNIIDLIIDQYIIDIISLQQRFDDVEEYRGLKIQYIKSYPYYIFLFREKYLKQKRGFLYVFYGLITLGLRLFSFITRLVSASATNVVLTRAISKKMRHILKKNKYDYVLCIGKPFETFVAALPLAKKFKNTKFIGYQVDNFVTGEDKNYPSLFMSRRNIKRKVILNECAKLFYRYLMLESIYCLEAKFLENNVSVKSLGLPLLINRREMSEMEYSKSSANRVTFVYTGSLLKAFRPPEDCLNIMMEVAKKKAIRVELYQRGDCNDILEKYEKQSNSMIINHGTVSVKESYRAMEHGDILLAISNYAGDQISGKTFEYMSTGKPVVFFYYSKEDMNIRFFDKYDAGLCIRMSPTKEIDNAEKIVRFVEKNIGRIIPFEQVKKQFSHYTPENIVSEIFRDDKK